MRRYYSYFLPLFLCLVLISACASGDRAKAPQPISPEPLYTVVMRNGLVSEIVEKYNVGADELSETIYGYDKGQLARYDYKGRRAVSKGDGQREMLDIVLGLSFEDGKYVDGDKTVNKLMASPLKKDIEEAWKKSEDAKKRVLGTRYQEQGQKEIVLNSSNIMPAQPVEEVVTADEMLDKSEVNTESVDIAVAKEEVKEEFVPSAPVSTEDMSKKLINSPASVAEPDDQVAVNEFPVSKEKPLSVEDLIQREREPAAIREIAPPKEIALQAQPQSQPQLEVQQRKQDEIEVITSPYPGPNLHSSPKPGTNSTPRIVEANISQDTKRKSVDIPSNPEWPANLMTLMPAIETCLGAYQTPGLIHVPMAWTTKQGDISVFIQNKNTIHDCRIAAGAKTVISMHEALKKDLGDRKGRAVFSPHTSAYPDGECYTHDLMFDDANKFKGWLSTNGC